MGRKDLDLRTAVLPFPASGFPPDSDTCLPSPAGLISAECLDEAESFMAGSSACIVPGFVKLINFLLSLPDYWSGKEEMVCQGSQFVCLCLVLHREIKLPADGQIVDAFCLVCIAALERKLVFLD
jgi:hypothetical protein